MDGHRTLLTLVPRQGISDKNHHLLNKCGKFEWSCVVCGDGGTGNLDSECRVEISLGAQTSAVNKESDTDDATERHHRPHSAN